MRAKYLPPRRCSYGAMLIGIHGRLGGVSSGGSHNAVLTAMACGSMSRIHSAGIGTSCTTHANIPAANAMSIGRTRPEAVMSGLTASANPASAAAAGIQTHG